MSPDVAVAAVTGASTIGGALVGFLPALADKWAKNQAGKRVDREAQRQHDERMAGGAE